MAFDVGKRKVTVPVGRSGRMCRDDATGRCRVSSGTRAPRGFERVCTEVWTTRALATRTAYLTRVAKPSWLGDAVSDGRYWARTSPPHSGHGWTGLASAVGERMVEPHAGSQRWTGAATSDAPVRCECGRDVDGVRVGIRSTGPGQMNKRRQQLAALGS
jgi:hypothetical protein